MQDRIATGALLILACAALAIAGAIWSGQREDRIQARQVNLAMVQALAQLHNPDNNKATSDTLAGINFSISLEKEFINNKPAAPDLVVVLQNAEGTVNSQQQIRKNGNVAFGPLQPGLYKYMVGTDDDRFLPSNGSVLIQKGEQAQIPIILRIDWGKVETNSPGPAETN